MTNGEQLDKQAVKDEFYLSVDDYGKCASYDNLLAIAKLAQTLFLIIPGSYPNHPELGIGIQTYQFEFLDKTTLNEIQDKANRQLQRYVSSKYILSTKIEAIENEQTGKKDTLGVLLNLIPYQGFKTDNLILTFSQLDKKGKVISKLYI